MKSKELQKILSAVIQKNNLDTELMPFQIEALNETLRAFKDEISAYGDDEIDYEIAQVIHHLMKGLV